MSERTPMSPIAGLSRTAAVPPPPPRPKSKAEKVVPDAAAEDVERRGVTGQRPTAKPKPKTSSTEGDMMRAISISLPVNVVARLKERSRRDAITQTEVLLDAIVASQEKLGELVKPPESVADGLFIRRAVSRAAIEPMTALSLRMVAANVAAIDNLVDQHGAPSRSSLCAAALVEYLSESEE